MSYNKMTSSPGSFVDATAPLRSFFDQVSNKYARIAQEEDAAKERALTRAADEENRRADRLFKVAEFGANEAQRENARRIANAQEQRLSDAAALEANTREARRLFDEYMYDPQKRGQLKFQLSDYSPEVRNAFQTQLDLVNNLSSDTRKFISGDSTVSLDKLKENYKTLLGKSGLAKDPAAVNNYLADFENDVLSLQDEGKAGGYTPEAWQKRAQEAVAGRFGGIADSINEGISQGKGMLRENYVNAFMRQLDPEVTKYLLRSDIDKALGTTVGQKTRQQYLDTEKARVEALNAANKTQIELADKYFQRAISANNSGSSGYSKNAAGITKAIEAIGGIGDIGFIDNKNVKDGFTFLAVEKNIDPEIAAAAIKLGVDRGMLGDSFPAMDSPEFAELTALAESLQGAKRSSGGKVFIDPKLYQFTPETPRSLLDLQLSDFSIKGNSNYRLPVNPQFDRRTIAQKNSAADQARELATFARKSEQERLAAEEREQARASIAKDVLDLSSPKKDGRSLKLSEKQQDSRAYVRLEEQIEKQKALLEKAPNPRAKRMYQKDLNDLLNQREALLGKLITSE